MKRETLKPMFSLEHLIHICTRQVSLVLSLSFSRDVPVFARLETLGESRHGFSAKTSATTFICADLYVSEGRVRSREVSSFSFLALLSSVFSPLDLSLSLSVLDLISCARIEYRESFLEAKDYEIFLFLSVFIFSLSSYFSPLSSKS